MIFILLGKRLEDIRENLLEFMEADDAKKLLEYVVQVCNFSAKPLEKPGKEEKKR